MKKKNAHFMLMLLGICLAVSTSHAIEVEITNPGFEDPVMNPGESISDNIPGWEILYGLGGELAVNEDYSLGGWSENNVAWSYTTVSTANLFGQTVGTITENTKYTLTVKVGDRDTVGYDTNFPYAVYARLHDGTSFLTPESIDAPVPPNGGFVTWTMVYDVPAESDLVGSPLIVYLGCSGGYAAPGSMVQFDDVTLDARLLETVPGDANRDGMVNQDDAEILAANWLTQTGADWDMGDFNDDGVVNDIDATLLATNWQQDPNASQTVPEPSIIAGLLVLCITEALVGARRKIR